MVSIFVAYGTSTSPIGSIRSHLGRGIPNTFLHHAAVKAFPWPIWGFKGLIFALLPYLGPTFIPSLETPNAIGYIAIS
eukprot:6214687-Pleurochrysis_carterae.AAC.7